MQDYATTNAGYLHAVNYNRDGVDISGTPPVSYSNLSFLKAVSSRFQRFLAIEFNRFLKRHPQAFQ